MMGEYVDWTGDRKSHRRLNIFLALKVSTQTNNVHLRTANPEMLIHATR